MNGMFSACSALKTIPFFNTQLNNDFTNFVSGCSALQTIPPLNTSLATNVTSMFATCPCLTKIPALNLGNITTAGNLGNLFLSCFNLANVAATGMKISFSVTGCKLSAAALNTIYTNLATVVGQTITVTNNYGTATDNPAIATAKGWTVTG